MGVITFYGSRQVLTQLPFEEFYLLGIDKAVLQGFGYACARLVDNVQLPREVFLPLLDVLVGFAQLCGNFRGGAAGRLK